VPNEATGKMTELQKYLKTLRSHPGVPIATACMFLGFVAGARGEHWFRGGLVGAAIMCVFWIPVLLTAWSNRNGSDD
jgi:hypothetical protein